MTEFERAMRELDQGIERINGYTRQIHEIDRKIGTRIESAKDVLSFMHGLEADYRRGVNR